MIYWETAFFLCCQPAMSSEHPRRPADKLPQQTATTRLTVRSHQCRLIPTNPQTATTSLTVRPHQCRLIPINPQTATTSLTIRTHQRWCASALRELGPASRWLIPTPPPNRDHKPNYSHLSALACQRASRTGSSVTLADTNKPSNRDHEPNSSLSPVST